MVPGFCYFTFQIAPVKARAVTAINNHIQGNGFFGISKVLYSTTVLIFSGGHSISALNLSTIPAVSTRGVMRIILSLTESFVMNSVTVSVGMEKLKIAFWPGT